MRFTVVIPAWNEAEGIAAAVESARLAGAFRIVVADGGSTDDTAARAAESGADVIAASRGRARQQNAGAAVATEEGLLFLHADARLAPDCLRQAADALADRRVAAVAFRQQIEATGWRFRLLEVGNAARVRWRGIAYGDQGIGLRRETFLTIGGFPDVRLLEDLLLSRQLRRQGHVRLLPGPIRTSARRWQRHGVLRQTVRNQVLLLAHRCGVSPDRLAEFYAPHRDEPDSTMRR